MKKLMKIISEIGLSFAYSQFMVNGGMEMKKKRLINAVYDYGEVRKRVNEFL